MHWLTELRNIVLTARSISAAASVLAEGKFPVPAALHARAEFMRNAWVKGPRTVDDLSEALRKHAIDTVASALNASAATIEAAVTAAETVQSLPDEVSPIERSRHHVFVYHGLRHLEAVSHLNPWSDATSRAGRLLSNLTWSPFFLHGRWFTSGESYLQSMRLPPASQEPSRSDVAAMSAVDAQAAGRGARRLTRSATKLDDPVWLWEREEEGPVERRSPSFESAMTEALLAKVSTHPVAVDALSATAELSVVHYLRRRGRYLVRQDSHLGICLPEVRRRYAAELPRLSEEQVSYWRSPSHNGADFGMRSGPYFGTAIRR